MDHSAGVFSCSNPADAQALSNLGMHCECFGCCCGLQPHATCLLTAALSLATVLFFCIMLLRLGPDHRLRLHCECSSPDTCTHGAQGNSAQGGATALMQQGAEGQVHQLRAAGFTSGRVRPHRLNSKLAASIFVCLCRLMPLFFMDDCSLRKGACDLSMKNKGRVSCVIKCLS